MLAPRIALTSTSTTAPVTSPANALLIFNTNTAGDVTPGFYYWSSGSSAWVRVLNNGDSSGDDWKLIGNAGTTAGTQFIGTTDAVDWVVKTNNAERMRVTSGGNVGIGTTPSGQLHVYATENTASTGSKGIALSSDGWTSFSMDGPLSTKSFGLHYGNLADNIIRFGRYGNNFGAWEANSVHFDLDASGDALTVSNNGNVGIGTANPSAPLYVNASRNTGSTGTKGIAIASTGWTSVSMDGPASTKSVVLHYGNDGDNVLRLGRYGDNFGTWEANPVHLDIDAPADALVLVESGNVGISTSDPQAKLHIGAFNDNHLLLTSANNDYGWRMDTKDNGGGDVPFRIYRRTAGSDTQVFTIRNENGYVGIGTGAPGFKLHVEDNDASGVFGMIKNNGAGNATLLLERAAGLGGGKYWLSAARTGTNFSIGADGGVEFFTITSTGNVGIGNTAPAEKLHVTGNTRISGLAGTGTRMVQADANGTLTDLAAGTAAQVLNGVGTWVDPNTLVNGDNLGNHTATTTLEMAANTINAANKIFINDDGANEGIDWQGGRNISIYTAAQGGYNGFVFNTTGTFPYVFNGANVGIGTTTPNGKLEIGQNGGLRFSGTGLNATDKKLYSPADGVLEWMTHNSAGEKAFAVSHQGAKAVYLSTSGSSYLVGGNVGIGTTTPGARLDVEGTSYISEFRGDGTDVYLRLYNDRASAHDWQIGALKGSADGDGFVIRDVTSAAARLMIDEAGDVGIGNTNPTYKLHVNGKIKTDDITETSDARLKKDIVTIPNALERVTQLRGVNFNWRTGQYRDRNFDTGLQMGVIAQEMEQVIPEVVSTDTEGYKSVEYSKLVGILIEAIKELEAENNAVHSEMEQLQKEYAARMDQMERALGLKAEK